MHALIAFFVTPALVSLVVSLWAGRLMEARRARRDHITKLYESIRDDVRRATEAAVDYFATPPTARSALQEAKVIGADRDIRAAVPMVLSNYGMKGATDGLYRASSAFENLVVELTGGNFQVAEGSIDRDHILRLVHAGAEMRTSLARLRDDQLIASAEEDFLVRLYDKSMLWAAKNSPFRDNGPEITERTTGVPPAP